jgi:hypothetical protein
MELWDLHHIRRLDDTGFIDGLYGKAGGRRPADAERIAELKKQQSDANDAIKTCGHLESEYCECH